MKVLRNNSNEIYFAEINMDRKAAIQFLRGFWKAVNPTLTDHLCDEDILRELTDRMQDVRTRYSGGEIVIYTHAWDPSGDKDELPKEAITYLKEHGLEDAA